MRPVSRYLALAVAAFGVLLAGWGPVVFEVISGRQLPLPVATDEAAMLAWSGVAFLRVLGATLFVLGIVLNVSHRAPLSPRAPARALAISAAFATLVVLAQAQAIWSTAFGFLLAGIFAALALAGAFAGWLRPSQQSAI